MIEQVISLIIDESKWLPLSMGLAFLTVGFFLHRQRHSGRAVRIRILTAMNLFCGVTIGTMALGHLLAVTVKLSIGTLQGSVLLFYVIGIVLIIPASWLIYHTRSLLVLGDQVRRKTITLNAWLAITLLALGIHNLPLALPAVLTIGYQLHSRRATGWALVSLTLIVNLGLFIGAVIFLASGQSFEQFSGME